MQRREERIWAVPWGLHFDTLECHTVWMESKYFVGLLKRKLDNHLRRERGLDFRMDCKAKIVKMPMMLHAQQDPILQGVHSPVILL